MDCSGDSLGTTWYYAVEPVRPVHGGLNLSELRALGLRPDQVLDFSASINPLGASPLVREALQRVDLAAYPDPGCRELREALSDRLGLEPDRILIGNGATELIHLIARSLLTAGDAAAVLTPTFSEYDAACRLPPAGGRPRAPRPGRSQYVPLGPAGGRAANRGPAAGRPVRLQPNNPTGTYLSEAEVEGIAAALGDRGLLVLDEAYAPFVDQPWDATRLLRARGNVALLRSMTKDHALTGLRLGYLLASRDVLERAARFQHSWSVNAAAQAAGVAALADPGHVERGRAAVRAGRSYLRRELGRLGLPCSPSATNFLLVRVGDAAAVRLRLLREHRVCVRDCASFGLPEHVRIGVRRMEDCRRLAGALQEVMVTSDG